MNNNAVLEQALPHMNVQPDERILEIGCGDGWACRRLAAAAPQGLLIGLDKSNDNVREARALSTAFENILYVWSSAEQIPWQEDFFTAALCVDSIDAFDDLDQALAELHRVLAPAGRLWIINSIERQARPTEDYLALLRQHRFEEVAGQRLRNAPAKTQANNVDLPPRDSPLLITACKPKA